MAIEDEDQSIDLVALFGGTPFRGDRFSVYVPNKDRDGASINQRYWVDAFLSLFAEINGGASALPAMTGVWRNPETGHHVVEEPIVIYTFIDAPAFAERLGEVVRLVKRMGRDTNQGEIAMEFNGEFFTTAVFD
jgi:hypothetical protein